MSALPSLDMSILRPNVAMPSLPSPPPSPSPNEVEAGRCSFELSPSTGGDVDPLLLRSKLQSQEHISNLRHRGGKKEKKLSSFYRVQNEQILTLLKPIEHHEAEAEAKESDERLQVNVHLAVVLRVG
jgi:hypothetical protein